GARLPPIGEGPPHRDDHRDRDAHDEAPELFGDVAIVASRAVRHRTGDVEQVTRNPDARRREEVSPAYREAIVVEPAAAERRIVVEEERQMIESERDEREALENAASRSGDTAMEVACLV